MIPFGRAWRERFPLDPEVVYLNHGTVGVTPLEIGEVQHQIMRDIERNPARFLLRELTEVGPGPARGGLPHLRAAAERVAAFLGVEGRDLVFADNTSTAINAVLRSFPFESGDVIVLTSLGYGSVAHAAGYVARRQGLSVHTVPLPFPVADPAAIVAAFEAGLPPKARLAIVDHISADTALLLPIREMARVCRERGILLLVDGAHAPGSIALDIDTIGADLYVGNLHKWMWTPRSSGILWARRELQPLLHPTVISWGTTFTSAFDLPGTRDPSPHLTAPHAVELLERIGLDAIRQHNHDLVWAGGRLMAERWGTEIVTPESMVASMVCVPLPTRLGVTRTSALQLRLRLQDEHQIELHVAGDESRGWVRVAAQVYNELSDFERAAEVIAAL
jgi:isopenicillin-N epimerase